MPTRSCFMAMLALCLFVSRAAADPVDLALGHTVKFSPAPNGSGTSAGDATDLTDGILSTWQNIWGDPVSVAWLYPGLAQLGTDLGAGYDIGEVAIRISGGSTGDGKAFPSWVALAASDDGVTYHRVASYSRFTPGDQAKYGVPAEGGIGWAYTLRFENINIHARYIGIELYGSSSCGADELYVMSLESGTTSALSTLPVTNFSVNVPRAYFHKPVQLVATNINAPVPIGLNVPSWFTQNLTFEYQLPPGMHNYAGKVGGTYTSSATGKIMPDGFTSFTTTATRTAGKDWSKIFLRYDANTSQPSVIRYRLYWPGGSTPVIEQPVAPITVGSAPMPRRIMTGLCYWSWGQMNYWPDKLHDFMAVGFNTLPIFVTSTTFDAATTATIEQFRAAGFKMLNVDNTFANMLTNAGSRKGECCCQYSGGGTGSKMCPSYRGDLYWGEIARVADQCAKVKIDILTCDTELWASGPDSLNCTRCQADYAVSGAASWDEWKLIKGEQMVADLVTGVRLRAGQLGIDPAEVGFYDFRPGMNYHTVWPFDRVYPAWLSNSQVSTYSPLYPYNVIYTGNEVRRDRSLLPKSDVMPWISPGDHGVFPGEMLKWTILECYANGSRGVQFWSARMWDAEILDAYARSTRIIAPVENIVVDGSQVSGVACTPSMRVSGMVHANGQFLLIAKDYEPYSGSVLVAVPHQVPVQVIDLDANQLLTTLTGAQTSFTLTFNNQRARALHIKPVETFDPNLVYVEFPYFGEELGTLSYPFNSIAEGVAAANVHATIRMFTGNSAEHPRIAKPLRIEAIAGPARIGWAAH